MASKQLSGFEKDQILTFNDCGQLLRNNTKKFIALFIIWCFPKKKNYKKSKIVVKKVVASKEKQLHLKI